MKSIFSGEHYYDSAKQAKFLPHPALALLLFILVYYTAQYFSEVPVIAGQIVFALNNGIGIADVLAGKAVFNGNEAGILIIIKLLSTSITAALVILYCRFIECRSLKSMGLSRDRFLSRYGIGAVIGFAMFSAVVGITALAGAASCTGSGVDNGLLFAGLCAGWVIQGAEEEIVCRGFLMTTLSERMPAWAAVVINSALFSAMHLFNNGTNVLALINIFLWGIVLSLLAIRSNSLIPSCALHSVWNWAQGNFYGLPVSGMLYGSSVLKFELSEGRELWTGGSFGLEGGLGATAAAVLAIGLILFLPKKKASE